MDCPQVRTLLFYTGNMFFKILWILELEYVLYQGFNFCGDGDIMFLRNVGICLQVHTMLLRTGPT
jgi:hypothetical protein